MDALNTESQYFLRRAAEERAAADRSTDPRARQTHIDLAERYSEAAQTATTANSIVEQSAASPMLRPEFRILP